MMVGLIEFMYRLLNPIEEKSPRMYHFDVAYGQLIGMLLLSLICYQFTIVGEGVYIDAIRAFIGNYFPFQLVNMKYKFSLIS